MAAPALKVQIQGVTTASADNLNTYAQTCDTVAELRGFVGVTGVQVSVRGISAINDGGAGDFYWNASGTGPDNGRTIIVPTGSQEGCWVRIIYAQNGIWILASDYGILPNTGLDVTAALISLLNIANGIPVLLEVGTYIISSHLTGGISGGTTANSVRLVGAVNAFISGDAQPFNPTSGLTVISPTAGSTFNQFTPPGWIAQSYTVILFQPSANDCLFGQPDSASAFGYDFKLRLLENVVVWAGNANAVMAVHQPGQDTTIEGCTFAMFGWFGVCARGGGDNFYFKDVAAYDCGWNLAPTGTVSGNAPSYGAGCAFAWCSAGNVTATDYESYVGIPSSGPTTGYTQGKMESIYVFNRNYWLASMWGYAALQAFGTFDLKLDQFQSISAVYTANSVVTFDNCHIESFAQKGLTGSDSTYVSAGYFWNSQVVTVSGWAGNGFQAHYGQGSLGGSPWIFSGSGNYGPANITAPGIIALSPQNPITLGPPNNIGSLSPQTGVVNSSGGNTFTWKGVFLTGIPFDGFFRTCISITSGAHENDYISSSYAFRVTTVGGTLTATLGGGFGVNSNLPGGWTQAYTLSTNSNGDLILTIAWTSWTNGTTIQIDGNLIGGNTFAS